MEGDFILCQATVVFARWRLDDTDAVRHVKGIVVLREPHVGLLLAIRADEGVDLLALDLVHGLHRVLDVALYSVPALLPLAWPA